jgi:hypothetical protein
VLASSIAACISSAVAPPAEARGHNAVLAHLKKNALNVPALAMTNATTNNSAGVHGGVCAFVPSPTAAANSVVQLVNASAPLSDTDATHALLSVVVAALLDASQVSVLWRLGPRTWKIAPHHCCFFFIVVAC